MPAERREGGRATYVAAPNIALVKYWGMRDVARGLPFNSSLSVTLNRFRTRTTVAFDPTLDQDHFALNGRPVSGPPLHAIQRFLDRVRELTNRPMHARVTSSNNFQTASGLASSASGFAALAGAATAAARVRLSPRGLSRLARLGSGSAARSVFGGFVEWRAGHRATGVDCYAEPLFGPAHWPALVDVVALIRGAPEKSVRSAEAMQRTVATSPGYRARLRAVPRRLTGIRAAIAQRDAERLFRLVIEECDDFRSVCETTDPPLDYLTHGSREVLATVRTLNEERGVAVAGYTHDAGAHVHIFTLATDAPELRRRLSKVHGVHELLTVRPGPGGRLLAG